MKYHIPTFLCLLINTLAFSQSAREISNVSIQESNSTLVIIYDAKSIIKGDSLKIEVKSKVNAKKSGKMGQRARLAQTLKGFK